MAAGTGLSGTRGADTMTVRHGPGARRLTLDADQGCDASPFVSELLANKVTPHIADRAALRVRQPQQNGTGYLG
jgi:hypothetical protein